MAIRSEGADLLFRAAKETDRHDEVNIRFLNFAKVPKTFCRRTVPV
jgi:hypothetical protein